ncbi:DUF4240 domain-containing protein [Nocardiopsis sp. N85]|uniref:DUF4240 domain-containing protein n=1 Tax=Nocardiopsis sp. N85 TaxID=3029400 RepID=UPI00237EFA52|nr:DUF4240 domain-containing protein [Nocardiopsis sp. N85]MDE3725032.1 DUF4240 domain-containing protein [Nocardiopsis sp. N85]
MSPSVPSGMLDRMDEDFFWRLIDEGRAGSPTPDIDADHLTAFLTERLSNGTVAQVVGFAEQLSLALYRLDRREHGEALSSDAFLYSRAAVVADGRETYEAVLADPVLFAPYAEEPLWAEGLLYVPDRVYEHLTGEEWRRDTRHSYESYSNRDGWASSP